MSRPLQLAGYAGAVALSAAVAAGAATLALGSPPRHASPARTRPDDQAVQIVNRYLAALRDHDWPGACTLMEEQAACLQSLADTTKTFGSFDVVAATVLHGRAVASVTVDGIPCRVTLVRSRNQWLIVNVAISSAASAGPAPADSTALGA